MRAFAALVTLAAAAALVVAGWFAYVAFGDRRLPDSATTVIVERGESAAGVAKLLAREHVIVSARAFDALARLRRLGTQVKAGEFRFEAHRTTAEVLRQVTTQGAQVAQWVTLPEGFTARQMAAAIAGRGISTEDDLQRVFLSQSIDVNGTPTASLEGYLFPSTYLIPRDASAGDVANILTAQFRKALPADAGAQAVKLGLSVPQIVTLASLIEREAKADDERALMAGVYYNRLRLHMPLEVDATIEYIFPEHKTVITRADLSLDSPYNTYRNAGLPPTPIANPGRPSLVAAFHPQSSHYLYYVYKGDGHHAFSRTLAEHEANVARYLH